VVDIAPVGRVGGPIEAVVAIGQDQSKIDILQQQIVRAERLATLGELAAGVVHELNNPLTSITVYAEYLVRKLEAAGTEAPDLEKLRRIGASAQRILRFSRDLVQYARPSGRDMESVESRSGRAVVGLDLRAPDRARRDRARESRSIPSCRSSRRSRASSSRC